MILRALRARNIKDFQKTVRTKVKNNYRLSCSRHRRIRTPVAIGTNQGSLDQATVVRLEGATSNMGMIIGFSFLALVLVGLVVCAVTFVSIYQNRKHRRYRFASILCFVVGPILPLFFSASTSAVTNDFHRERVYFITATFSLTNAVVIVGSLLLVIPLLIRNDITRVMSATSWGLLSAYIVNIVRMMILIMG